MELTAGEMTILGEALDAWVVKDGVGELMSFMLGAMFIKEGDPGYDEYKRKEAIRENERTAARKLREEQVTLLKAKLIMMRMQMHQTK